MLIFGGWLWWRRLSGDWSLGSGVDLGCGGGVDLSLGGGVDWGRRAGWFLDLLNFFRFDFDRSDFLLGDRCLTLIELNCLRELILQGFVLQFHRECFDAHEYLGVVGGVGGVYSLIRLVFNWCRLGLRFHDFLLFLSGGCGIRLLFLGYLSLLHNLHSSLSRDIGSFWSRLLLIRFTSRVNRSHNSLINFLICHLGILTRTTRRYSISRRLGALAR